MAESGKAKGKTTKVTTPAKAKRPPKPSGSPHVALSGPISPVGAQLPQIVPAHGRGALNAGGTPGNAGGPGRPSSVIRAELAGSFDQRKVFLSEVIDGKVYGQQQVPLAAVMPHLFCPSCSGPLMAQSQVDIFFLMIPIKVSPSVKERLQAFDLLGKYGVGALKEVSTDDVRGRVEATMRVIREQSDAETAARILTAMEPIWTA